jgi:peroxiredoxin
MRNAPVIILKGHMSQLPIGVQAPDFELSSEHHGHRRLSEALKQGPVVLVFYKAACSTCQFAFPFIQQIYSKVAKTAPWTLWAISEDDVDETLDFVGQNGLTFDVLIDEHPYAVSSAYELHNVPAIFVIQPDGKISLSDFGFTKDTLNQIAGFAFFTPDDGLPSSRPG